MKKVLIAFISLFVLAQVSYAFNLNGSGLRYAGRTKYYPQGNIYANRYQRPRSNYIYSPQQARYYGYRVPQQNMRFYSPYNNPYRR